MRVSVWGLVLGATAAFAADGFEFFDAVELPHTADRLLLADLDGDGQVDLLSSTTAALELRRGDGAGGFAATGVPLITAQDIGEALFVVLETQAADLDADGDLDVVAFVSGVRSGATPLVGVFENAGDGTFSRATFSTVYVEEDTGVARRGAAPFALLDVDRNGELDVVAAATVLGPLPEGAEYYSIATYSRGGDGAFAFAGSMPAPGPYVIALKAADVNGDQRADLVVGSNVADVFLARADGGFDAVVPDESLPLPGPPLFVGDIDADGHADVISYGNAHLGAGDGTFPSSRPIDTPIGSGIAAFVDIDNDLDIDIVSYLSSRDGLLHLTLQQDGEFVDAGTIETGSSASVLASVVGDDVDGNGLVDLVVAESVNGGPVTGDGVIVLRQAGTPAPSQLAFVPRVIERGGPQDFELSGRNFEPGADVDLGADISVTETSVVGANSAIARAVVPQAIGGGTRSAVLTNPDGRRTQAQFEVHSIAASIRSGKLRDRITPSDDTLRLRGRLRRNELSRQDRFAGPALGMVLQIGPPSRPLEIVIPADDPRWTERRGGRRLVFATEPTQFPRVRLVVNTRKETFVLKVTEFDYPDDVETLQLTYRAGDDLGRTQGTWRTRRRSFVLRNRPN